MAYRVNGEVLSGDFEIGYADELNLLRCMIQKATDESEDGTAALAAIAGPISVVVSGCEKLLRLQQERKELLTMRECVAISSRYVELMIRELARIPDQKLRDSIIDSVAEKTKILNETETLLLLEDKR